MCTTHLNFNPVFPEARERAEDDFMHRGLKIIQVIHGIPGASSSGIPKLYQRDCVSSSYRVGTGKWMKQRKSHSLRSVGWKGSALFLRRLVTFATLGRGAGGIIWEQWEEFR